MDAPLNGPRTNSTGQTRTRWWFVVLLLVIGLVASAKLLML